MKNELAVTYKGVKYWYSEENAVYMHNKFGYPSHADFSNFPPQVKKEMKKIAKGK